MAIWTSVSIWLKILFTGEKDLILGYIYRPPSSTVEWYALCENMLESTSRLGLNVVLKGDFNIDLLSADNVKLTQIMQAYNLTQVIKVPNHAGL